MACSCAASGAGSAARVAAACARVAAGPISQRDFEEMLRNSKFCLCPCPVSTQHLLFSLQNTESALSRIGQHPPASMVDAISPLSGILLHEKVQLHPNDMVGITALSCLSQIIRISMPKAPYNDEEMKKIFNCLIAAFEKLPIMAGPCYRKTAKVLTCLAEIRGFAMLLDIDYALALNAFQLFPKVIRPLNPYALLLSMQDIMVQLIQEHDEVPLDFMLPLLEGLKMELQETAPLPSSLVHLVLAKCAAKLHPRLRQVKNILKLNLEEYSETVQLICQEVPEEQTMESVTDFTPEESDTEAGEDKEKGIWRFAIKKVLDECSRKWQHTNN